MRDMVEILLWAWIILDSRASSVVLPKITDEEFIGECVKEHNKARSSVSPPASDMLYMTWDEGLAITARAWAKNCMFKHNIHLNEVRRMHPTFPSVGENIWVGYPPSLFNVKEAMRKWVNEKKDYDYQSKNCTDVCGHYTQVVWASSYKVGCAVQLCPKGVQNFSPKESVLFVCNYAPAGNVQTMHPYQSKGSACSGCNETCVEKLCRSQERDSRKSYKWTPDWEIEPQAEKPAESLAAGPDPQAAGSDPQAAGSDPQAAGSASGSAGRPNYATILIVRPVALFFTFVTAYAVHYTYPNIFWYE